MTAARNENTTPSFEILEPRVLLDGDITATLAGSTLVIQGDSQPNAVIVYGTATPGQFVVSGVTHSVTGNQTTVNGDPFELFDGVTSGVKVDMGLGDDELLIGTPGATATTTIQGNISIDMGGGTVDGVYIGFDPDAFVFLGDVDILGSLTIQGSDAEDVVFLTGVGVGKNLTMKLGDSPTGTSNFVIMNRNATEATSNFIGGKLSMTGGDGIDNWFIGETTVTGSAQFKLGDTPDGETDKITIEDSTISGAVKITGGDGREDISVINSLLHSFSVQLKGGDVALGSDQVGFSATQLIGNIKISGNGDSFVDIFANSTVFGSLSIRAKDDVELNIDDSFVAGKVRVSRGAYAGVYLTQSASITGDLALKGKFASQLGFYQASSIDGNVKFSGGSGQDWFDLASGCEIIGSAKINFRTPQDGQDESANIQGNMRGDLSVIGGNGREEIVIEGVVTGNLKIDLKGAPVAGSNLLEITNGSVVVGDVSIRSKGEMSITIDRSHMYKRVNIKLGKEADEVEITDCVFGGSFILDTSDGNDRLAIDSLAATGSNFFGTVTVKMGNGEDSIEIGDIFGDGTFGATFRDECSFDGGSDIDQLFALDPAYDNDFQLGVPDYRNLERVF